MVVLCTSCRSIEEHNKRMGDEKRISVGDFVEWSTGEFGDRGTFARGTVVKTRHGNDATYGHCCFLIDEEWGEQRIWHPGREVYRVDCLSGG